MRLDDLALPGRQGLEERERRSAGELLEHLDRRLIELDPLHPQRAPSLVLYPVAAQRLAQLVAGDGKQPRLRGLWSRLIPRQGGKRGRKRLGGEVERLLRALHAPPKEGEDGGEVPLVENAERLSARACRQQQFDVGASLPLLHTSYMTNRREL
jgi:hypothetical protein